MKEPTPLLSIVPILVASVFGAMGTFLYKTGTTHATEAGVSGLSLATEPRFTAPAVLLLVSAFAALPG